MSIEAFPVEHGVPVEGIASKRNKYPWRKLKVGDSFFVPGDDWEIKSMMNSLTSCKNWATYKTGFRFVMRSVLGGIRIWRVQ